MEDNPSGNPPPNPDRNPSGITPHRTIRVPDDLWRAAQSRATERHETLTDVILRCLRAYVSDDLS